MGYKTTMSKIIKIFNTEDYVTHDYFPPKPASEDIPDWYKEESGYVNNDRSPLSNGQIDQTIKRCVPIFDVMTAGYIIYSQVDVYVSPIGNGVSNYTWPQYRPIEFHSPEQASKHPFFQESPIPKWINPYSINTPPGYSVLITQPSHRPSVFTIFSGIVDTDKYPGNINFPFVLNDKNFEGIIPAGTPIAQIIPFKRDSFKLVKENKKDIIKRNYDIMRVRSVFVNGYRKMFWQRKEYK